MLQSHGFRLTDNPLFTNPTRRRTIQQIAAFE